MQASAHGTAKRCALLVPRFGAVVDPSRAVRPPLESLVPNCDERVAAEVFARRRAPTALFAPPGRRRAAPLPLNTSPEIELASRLICPARTFEPSPHGQGWVAATI